MYSEIGTPDDQKQMKREWSMRLSEIGQRLEAFKKSRFQPMDVSSPDNSQVCVCVFVCVYMYVHVHVCVCMYMCVRACINVLNVTECTLNAYT